MEYLYFLLIFGASSGAGPPAMEIKSMAEMSSYSICQKAAVAITESYCLKRGIEREGDGWKCHKWQDMAYGGQAFFVQCLEVKERP